MKVTSTINDEGNEDFTLEPVPEGTEGWEIEQRFMKALAIQFLQLGYNSLKNDED